MWVKPKSKQQTIISSGVIERIKCGRKGKKPGICQLLSLDSLSSQITKKNQLSYSGSHF